MKKPFVIMALIVLFFAFMIKQSDAFKPKDNRFKNDRTAVRAQLDSYRAQGVISANFVCDNENVSVVRYSATGYTLLEIRNKVQKDMLFSFSNDEEALAGGNINDAQKYFYDADGYNDAKQINVTDFIKTLGNVSPNFYKFIARAWHKPSDTDNDSLFKNDCHATNVGGD